MVDKRFLEDNIEPCLYSLSLSLSLSLSYGASCKRYRFLQELNSLLRIVDDRPKEELKCISGDGGSSRGGVGGEYVTPL